ncbi:hypothetical protein JW835_11870 [bacterium]|nr:hypothetical protein [bacterium]
MSIQNLSSSFKAAGIQNRMPAASASKYKNIVMKNGIIILLLFIVLTSWFTGCRRHEQLAAWQSRDISINGKITEWTGFLTLVKYSDEDQIVRHAVRFIIMFGLLILAHYSKGLLSGKAVLAYDPVKLPESDEAYVDIRLKWTIVLKPAVRKNRPLFILSGPPKGGHGSDFPLSVAATLMRVQVIEAGFSHYAEAINMNQEQAADFQKACRQQHELDKYLLIEALLQTRMADNYLDLDRWTIFIEDDTVNQNVPKKIVKLARSSVITQEMMEVPNQKQQTPFEWTHHRKTVLLYFSRKDYYGKPVLHDDLKTLKLVFLLEKGGTGRAEGSWIFKSD